MYNSIDEVINEIKEVLNNKSVISIFAYNGTGKTRITKKMEEFNSGEEKEYLYYGSFFTDIMSWNNEQNCIKFNNDNVSDILTIAIDEGLDGKIVDEFNLMIGNKNIVPLLDFSNNEFKFKCKDNNEFIKISKGEENLFYWSWFSVIIENMYDNLTENITVRSNHKYDKIKYIIIDDPVSSLDDSKIITLAVKIADYIKRCQIKELKIKFIITTHHTLFYNVIFNELKGKSSFYELQNKQSEYKFEQQKRPIPYHLYIKKIIDNAIKNDEVYKFHFNMFRNLLEKTAIYFGYDNWKDCIAKMDSYNEFVRIIGNFSHNDIDELENKKLPKEHIELFTKVYNDFIRKFNFN